MNRSNTLLYSLLILWLFVSCFTGATQITGTWKTYTLKRHNDARKAINNGNAVGKTGKLPLPQSNLGMLTWDTKLAALANEYAQSCANGKHTCTHSGPNKWTPRKGWSNFGLSSRPGENIGCPTQKDKSSFPGDYLTKAWWNTMIDRELAKYWYQNKNYYPAGHYTQIIWAKTTAVGCAYHKCNKGWWMVCHYDPAGNYNWAPYKKKGSGPSPTPRPTPRPQSGSGSSNGGACIKIAKRSTAFNGNWKRQSKKNGKYYYTHSYKKNGRTKKYYLFWSTSNVWAINTGLSNPSNWHTYGYCQQSSLTSCGKKWIVNRAYDKDVTVRSGTCNAFEVEDTSCFDNYASKLHFYEENTAEPSHVFDRDDAEACETDNGPVYRYDDAQSMRYVLYSDVSRWVIQSIQNVSNFEIVTDVFVCNEEDLYECTVGTWFKEVITQYVSDADEDEGANVTVAGSTSEAVTYLLMEDAVIIGVADTDASNVRDGSGEVSLVAVIVCAALVLVLVVLAFVLYRCFNKRRMKNSVKQMEIPDEEEIEDEEGEDEVEVTVPIHTST
eukprot:152196_1